MRACCCVLVLAGCAARGDFTMAPDGLAGGTPETIFVGTTRKKEDGAFGFARADEVGFLRYDISGAV